MTSHEYVNSYYKVNQGALTEAVTGEPKCNAELVEAVTGFPWTTPCFCDPFS
ncbi:MAG: hypothetical protein PsegKO_33560 [Pseudohongiellaceae bacterium]